MISLSATSTIPPVPRRGRLLLQLLSQHTSTDAQSCARSARGPTNGGALPAGISTGTAECRTPHGIRLDGRDGAHSERRLGRGTIRKSTEPADPRPAAESIFIPTGGTADVREAMLGCNNLLALIALMMDWMMNYALLN